MHTNGSTDRWSNAEIETLARMLANGATFKAVAGEVGRSRNAVASRARTMGLKGQSGHTGGPEPTPGSYRQRRKERAVLPRPPKPKAAPKTPNPYAMPGKLKLAGMTDAPKPAQPPQLRTPPAPRPRITCTPADEALADAPLMVALVDLERSHCRWPVGDPREATFGFCGHPKVYGSYCAAHAARNVGVGTQGERSAEREARAAA